MALKSKLLVFVGFTIFIFPLADAQCSCNRVNTTSVKCVVSTTDPNLSTTCIDGSFNHLHIEYSGTTKLNLDINTVTSITIFPNSSDSDATLQLENFKTNASTIHISINLNTAQMAKPLFLAGITILKNPSLTVSIKQAISTIDQYKMFSTTTSLNITEYKIFINADSRSSFGTLVLNNLVPISGQIDRLIVSGSYHPLTVNSSGETTLNTVNSLHLNKLRLQEKILNRFSKLTDLSIEECQYSSTAEFLIVDDSSITTLLMKNNDAADSRLPQDDEAFSSLSKLKTITLNEEKLTSKSLLAMTKNYIKRITVKFGSYKLDDFKEYRDEKTLIWNLHIDGLSTLNVLPNGFFHALHALDQVTLAGSFALEKNSICAFAGIPVRKDGTVELKSSRIGSSTTDLCALIYIDAINYYSQASIRCPDYVEKDCYRWACEAASCDFSSYEFDRCSIRYENLSNRFHFANSALARYLNSVLVNHSTSTAASQKQGMSIVPIIGALCGLLFAITFLTVTIFCIRRRRQGIPTRKDSQLIKEGYPPNYNDLSHISIATSKTSRSMYPALDTSIFPSVKPNDEIAPPLYTPASESTNTKDSLYKPSAPPAYRPSVATTAPHVYETVDD